MLVPNSQTLTGTRTYIQASERNMMLCDSYQIRSILKSRIKMVVVVSISIMRQKIPSTLHMDINASMTLKHVSLECAHLPP